MTIVIIIIIIIIVLTIISIIITIIITTIINIIIIIIIIIIMIIIIISSSSIYIYIYTHTCYIYIYIYICICICMTSEISRRGLVVLAFGAALLNDAMMRSDTPNDPIMMNCYAKIPKILGLLKGISPPPAGLRPRVCPISLLRFSLLRLLDSRFPGTPLRAWEFHPLELRFCLSQTL